MKASYGRIVMISLLLMAVALTTIGCEIIGDTSPEEPDGTNNPEQVARDFIDGTLAPEYLAPDVRYEDSGLFRSPFEEGWWVRQHPRSEYQLDIHNVIVRDSLRPNSKEVTVIYSEGFWDPISPDPYDESIPLEEWAVADEYTLNDHHAAFMIVERLDGRWVL